MGLRKTVASAFLVPLVVIGLAACGSSKKSGSSSSAGAMTESVRTVDYKFEPATLTVKAGQKVTVHLVNDGTVEHNFSITSLKVNQDLEKGKSATATFTAPSTPGTIEYFCEYHRDSNGMKGTLTVT
jgi:plastocyanin